ncbi:hypothetical protein HNV12_22430 [Methanococcoides sp. SA1]|nr:hypothetical protein [Methanococcoides sp. SA1]
MILNRNLENNKNTESIHLYTNFINRILFFSLGGLFLYILSATKIYIAYSNTILLVFLLIGAFLEIKAVYNLFMSAFSKKTILLNYLYSPYFLAWRKDRLQEYSDEEIINAICAAINFERNSISEQDFTLKLFLIELCKKMRSEIEFNKYRSILNKNIELSEQMIYRY